VVEIAYGIAPAYQGRGFATEIANALVEFVSQSGEARTARAHTLPEENPSAGVLRKCGFQCLGEVMDPEDGPVWRWEKALDTPTGPLPKAGGER
jgi:[ribosomal protein S5]-alanine N-acetyltransferase